jgi:hypothetical protein
VTFTVDIHHHMLPDFFWRATNEGDHPVGGIAPPPWSRASTLSFLDEAGIDVAVTSISTPVCTLATTPRPAHWHDGRFGIIDEMRVIPGAEARATAAETFRRLYWDTALSWGDPVLRMLRDVVGIDHVLFGSDYPYLRRDLAVSCREHIEASPELTDSERTAVLGVTATKLIPRLASLRSQPQPQAS